MENKTVKCMIEHHAVLFALLSKQAILLAGESGKEAILKGMTKYGNERTIITVPRSMQGILQWIPHHI